MHCRIIIILDVLGEMRQRETFEKYVTDKVYKLKNNKQRKYRFYYFL